MMVVDNYFLTTMVVGNFMTKILVDKFLTTIPGDNFLMVASFVCGIPMTTMVLVSLFFSFSSDPGVPGVRSMGLLVFN